MISVEYDLPLPDSAGCVFGADYADARRNFLAACERAGVAAASRRHPRHGPTGEELACDVAWVGPKAARRVLVLVSATHGAEGFCGSAIQVDWLRSGGPRQLPDGCAVLLVHAINPFGFAWLRRVDEGGVDLNRNFVDFDAGLPADEGYAELADAMVPDSLAAQALAEAGRKVDAFAARHGQRALETALTSGQYTHPKGLFYGGDRPSWSRTTLEAVAADYDLPGRGPVVVVDLHTGLGPYGYGELICDHPPGSAGVELARQWFGPSVTQPLLGTSSSVPKRGLADYFWHRQVGDLGCMVTLEFGTWPLSEILAALQADHWLHARGEVDWEAPEAVRIKARIRRAFCPGMQDWKELVLFRGRQVVRQALEGLSSSPRRL